MTDDLASVLTWLVGRLVTLARDDPQFRGELRRAAQLLLDATADGERVAGGAEAEHPGAEAPPGAAGEPRVADPSATAPAPPREPLPELTLGRKPATDESERISLPSRWLQIAAVDLHLLEARCRLKAEGARWAARRRQLIAEGADFSTEIEPQDRDIIRRAKELPECFLWMCHPSGPAPDDLWLYEVVAGCYDTVADALGLMRQLEDAADRHQDEFERCLDLLAEAQSALRVAVAQIEGPTDPDQVQVYNWLRRTAGERQVYIQRYMRIDDPADPTRWSDLAARVEALDAALQESQQRSKLRKRLMGKVRYEANRCTGGAAHLGSHWQTLDATVEELICDGLPPSNRELRDLLLPLVDRIPDDFQPSRGMKQVLCEIDRYLAAYVAPTMPSAAPPSPAVQEVAKLLRGHSMVLIGGVRRPGADQALKDAFGLGRLLWIETREHQSSEGFEPYVARPDVAVVVLAIRWSSHGFGEVKEFCDRYNKPLVRLPGGYNPNQVAAQILDQCSERLRAESGGE